MEAVGFAALTGDPLDHGGNRIRLNPESAQDARTGRLFLSLACGTSTFGTDDPVYFGSFNRDTAGTRCNANIWVRRRHWFDQGVGIAKEFEQPLHLFGGDLLFSRGTHVPFTVSRKGSYFKPFGSVLGGAVLA